MADNTIFDLQQDRENSKFIAENVKLEVEVMAKIVETLMNIPYIGDLMKLGKVFHNSMDLFFVCKLGRFLKQANEIPEENVTKFVTSLSPKDKKRISDYLTQLLYTAEEDRKVDLMGKVSKRGVKGEIDIDMLLRLCSIVTRAYITDLDYLEEYQTVSETNTYVTDNLVALGLLADAGNMYEESGDGWESTGFGPTKHTLNEIGVMLYQILTDKTITQTPVKRINEHEIPSRPITAEELKEMFEK